MEPAEERASWRSHPELQDRPPWSPGRHAASWVWALAPLFTLGIANPASFLYAAVRRRTAAWWLVAAGYTGLVVVMFSISGAADGAPRDAIFTTLVMVNLVVGAGHALAVRRRVFEPDPVSDLTNDPVLASAVHAQERRELARRILDQDPALASDLGIGRPDLRRGYDDGGLVDVNTAPVGVLTGLLGLAPAHAERVVVARTAAGGFTSVEELTVLTDLPVELVDRLRDRVVLSPR